MYGYILYNIYLIPASPFFLNIFILLTSAILYLNALLQKMTSTVIELLSNLAHFPTLDQQELLFIPF